MTFTTRLCVFAVLALAVIPLGIVRNGLRIFTLGQLCIHVSPAMINSDLHRRGGPLFFAISLTPLFFLLLFLRRLEHRNSQAKGGKTPPLSPAPAFAPSSAPSPKPVRQCDGAASQIGRGEPRDGENTMRRPN